MKGFAMLRIGEVGWVEKPRPVCGPLDAVCRPLAAAVCTSDVHTVWEGAVGDRHDLIPVSYTHLTLPTNREV